MPSNMFLNVLLIVAVMTPAVCPYNPITRTHSHSQSSQAIGQSTTYPITEISSIIEIKPKGIKVPEDEGREEFDHLTLKMSHTRPIGRSTVTQSHSTSTGNNDKTSRMIKANLDTLSITSIRITLTKPGDPWTTLPDPDEGTTLPWFTDSTATSMTTTAEETASATTTVKTPSPTAPEETESPTPPKTDRLSGSRIAAAVIGALLGVALLLLCGCIAVQYRHKLNRPKPEPRPMYTARRETPAVSEPRSQSYFDVSTPNVSRILMAAWPDLFRSRRNPSPRPEPEPEVLIPQRPMYQPYVEDAQTFTSSVYSQDSRVQQMPEIPRPPGNYI
ncbi:hypothetical protein DER45DRAFT_539841 [Fusarium avenaceum]|nr:hypothetical protein DER45DRAFT_539841 [Fusarium avenaceum]